MENATINEYQKSSSKSHLAYSWSIKFPDGRIHTLCSLNMTGQKNRKKAKKKLIKSLIKKAQVWNNVGADLQSPLSPIERKKVGDNKKK